MLQYVIAGLVLGGIYAIASAGLVVTYLSAGILNFAFGALAYFIAREYYWLHVQHHMAIAPAAILAVAVSGPLLGVILYFALFRLLRFSSTLVKVVATLGVSVMIPPLAVVLFGNPTIVSAPGLAPEPVKVFKVDGVPVTLDQIIVYACVLAVVVVGAVVLRYTDVGLQVRAMVDSPAMTSLSGTSPSAVSVGVWAASVFLAGLAGVLTAPVLGLNPGDYTLLMAAAFAAVIAAKLRNLPVAVIVGLLMGVAGALVQYYLPPSSAFTAAAIPSIPFVVTAIFLVYNTVRWGRVNESEGVGGALDRAIAPQAGESPAWMASAHGGKRVRNPGSSLNVAPTAVMLAAVIIVPFIVSDFWVGQMAEGTAFAVFLLSFTLVVGEGGMIWLCQATFGGVGAIMAAQLVTHHGWPVLLAVLAGGLVALPMGVLIGMLTIRLGDLYVALVTLTFALLMENLVFTRNIFAQDGLGVNLPRPEFAHSNRALVYLGLAIFAVISLLIVNLRRSTTGLALNAVRWSEPGAKTLGISILKMKVIVAGLAAFVAGVGGALLAVQSGVALPANYATLAGVVWLAVLVTAGIRSNMAALIAGMMFTLIPAYFIIHLSTTWAQVPTILFGLGAVGLAQNPQGWVVQQGEAVRDFLNRLLRGSGGGGDPWTPEAVGHLTDVAHDAPLTSGGKTSSGLSDGAIRS